MKVSRLIAILIALLAAISFALTPVGAGEHPWNEGDQGNGGDARGNGGSSSDDPNTTTDVRSSGPLWGTSFWWWQFLPGGSPDRGRDTTPSTTAPVHGGKTQTSSRNGAAR
jgi:hypothetical protein